ncbi:unnamed protein product, partial [Phaeothamnion confervicola]
MRLHARSTDEAHRLTFVKKHLGLLLQLLCTRVSGPSPGTPPLPAPPPAKQQQQPTAAAAGSPGPPVAKDSVPSPSSPPGLGSHASPPGAGAPTFPLAEQEFWVRWSDLEALGFLISGGLSLDDQDHRGLAQLCPLWDAAAVVRSNAADLLLPSTGGPKGGAGGASKGDDACETAPRARAQDVLNWLAAAMTINEHVYPVPPSPAAVFFAEQHEDGPLAATAAVGGGGGSFDGVVASAAAGHAAGSAAPGGANGSGSSSSVSGGGIGAVATGSDQASAPLLINCVCRGTILHSDD